MKARLLSDAGDIHEGADVDIVARAGTNESRRPDDAGGPSNRPAPVYEVADDEGHAETVDTRDLRVIP